MSRPGGLAPALLLALAAGLLLASVFLAIGAVVTLLAGGRGDDDGLGAVYAVAALVIAALTTLGAFGLLRVRRGVLAGRGWSVHIAAPLLLVAAVLVSLQPVAWLVRGDNVGAALVGLVVAAAFAASAWSVFAAGRRRGRSVDVR